jgi:hypothetical protein
MEWACVRSLTLPQDPATHDACFRETTQDSICIAQNGLYFLHERHETRLAQNGRTLLQGDEARLILARGGAYRAQDVRIRMSFSQARLNNPPCHANESWKIKSRGIGSMWSQTVNSYKEDQRHQVGGFV